MPNWKRLYDRIRADMAADLERRVFEREHPSAAHFINIDDKGWYAVGPEGIRKIRRFLAENYVLGDLGDENERLHQELHDAIQQSIRAEGWAQSVDEEIERQRQEIERLREVERKALEQSEYIQTHGLTEIEVAALRAERDALRQRNRRLTWALRAIDVRGHKEMDAPRAAWLVAPSGWLLVPLRTWRQICNVAVSATAARPEDV